MTVRKHITFFYEDLVEKKTCEPIAAEAVRQGFEVSFTDNLKQKCEIGVYCQHECFPENAKFSLIMLHGMDQGRTRWPNIWAAEPWHKFDIGILPGEDWANRWRQASYDPYCHPKHGVFIAGWPKSDALHNKKSEFYDQTIALKDSLSLPFEHSVLYAPSFECDGKQHDVVEAFKDQPVNLLIKQWITEYEKDDYPDTWNNVQDMHKRHQDKYDNVKILNPNEDIMLCLALSDVLITDESSIAYEALLFDVPTVSVKGWPIRARNDLPARSVNPPNLVHQCEKSALSKTVLDFIENSNTIEKQNYNLDLYYACLGKSSERIVSILKAYALDDASGLSSDINPLKTNQKRKLSIQYTRQFLDVVRPLRKIKVIDQIFTNMKKFRFVKRLVNGAKGRSA